MFAKSGALLEDYSFGSVISTRGWSEQNRAYRFGFNTQEKDNELAGEGNSYTAEFWQYDGRLGRRWNIDPKLNKSISSYACFQNNPIFYNDPNGDTVKFRSCKDKINAFFSRIFNRDFRKQYKEWSNSTETYKFWFDKDSKTSITEATPSEVNGNPEEKPQEYLIRYSNGFELENISSLPVRLVAYGVATPFKIGVWSAKSALGIVSGIFIGVYNIFAKEDIGWGFGNRIHYQSGANLLSWGMGNYNKFDMFGKPLSESMFGNTKTWVSKEPGLVGLRIGQGKNYPPFFIDIFGEIYIGQNAYHFHLNFAGRKKRNEYLKRERIISFWRDN